MPSRPTTLRWIPRGRSRASAPSRISSAKDAAGASLRDEDFQIDGSDGHGQALRRLGAWLRRAPRRRPGARGRAPRGAWRPGLCDAARARRRRAATAREPGAAGAAAPAAQSRRDPRDPDPDAGDAAGRVLRYRLPPDPSRARRLVRPAAPVLRRGHPALRLPRAVLRVHRACAAARSRRRSPAGASWWPISAAAPACARSRTAARSTAPWASPRSTACRWEPAPARSTPAWCCT